ALDEYLPDLSGNIAVKIDTQGAEPFVLAAGRKTLSKARAIVMEFWPYGMAQLGATPDQVYALVKQFLLYRDRARRAWDRNAVRQSRRCNVGADSQVRRNEAARILISI